MAGRTAAASVVLGLSFISGAAADPPAVEPKAAGPSRYDDPKLLPLRPHDAELGKAMRKLKTRRLSELFGRKVDALPHLAEEMQLEVEDTRPWYHAYERPLGKQARGETSETIRWGFVDGELYQIRLPFEEKAGDLVERLRTLLGRKPDRTGTDRGGREEQTWVDGNLEIVVLRAEAGFALCLEDRRRAEMARAHMAAADVPERLVAKAREAFYSPAAHDIGQAVKLYEKAVGLLPRYGQAWIGLCQTRYEQGNADVAFGHCDKAIEVTTQESIKGAALYYQALVEIYRGETRAAVSRLEKARPFLAKSPDLAEEARVRLLALAEERDFDVLRHAVVELQCARARQGSRHGWLPREFGFADDADLLAAARAAGVGIDDAHRSAEARCGKPRP